MATLPQLLEEDITTLDAVLRELIARSESDAAVIIDRGGFLITKQGDYERIDVTTLGALAAASFAATQGIANLVGETDFNSVYQQGENHSMLVNNVDEHALLVIVFKAHVSAGIVKYYAAASLERIAGQLRIARERSPDEGLDLSVLNIADTAPLFRRKEA